MPLLSKSQEQFKLPSQLTKSKLSIKQQKIIRKQNLRNKTNIPKMIVDSQHDDIEQKQQQIAKKKAKKWWNSFNKKYFTLFNSLEDAQLIINKIQEYPINSDKLGNYFEEEFINQDYDNFHILQRNDTIRILFRREILLDQEEFYNLVFYQLSQNDLQELQSNDTEQDTKQVCINGMEIDVQIPTDEHIPSSVGIWAFCPANDLRMNLQSKDAMVIKNMDPSRLKCCSIQNSVNRIQKLLRHQKQQNYQKTISNELNLWTKKYYEIFEKNQKYLQSLAIKIQSNIDKRKLQQQIKQRQQLIVNITQKQLLWSQILLLFKKGHIDKAEQTIKQAMKILDNKVINYNQPPKGQKVTQKQKFQSQFQTDCKICFSTQSDSKFNNVFYCDGCNTSFHQICYGISKQKVQQIIQMQNFYCDVCNYYQQSKPTNSKRFMCNINAENQGYLTDKSENKIKRISCQICWKSNFPMKLINGHFYHVSCLFFFDFAQVKDETIIIKQNLTHQRILSKVIENQIECDFCQFCFKKQGMKFKCSSKKCLKWYHPICAYLNGIYFNLERNYRNLYVNLYCYDHQPEIQRNIVNQVFIRRFFCDYKKTSKLTQEEFSQQYAKEVISNLKDKNKQIYDNQILSLLKKPKVLKCYPSTSYSNILGKGFKKNDPDMGINENCQNLKPQSNIRESYQQNQFQNQRTEPIQYTEQYIDYARFIQQVIDFD